MNDRILRGATAGLIASLVQSIYGAFAVLIGLARYRYLDIGLSLTIANPHKDIFSTIVGYMAHFIFDAVLGVIFISIPKDSDRYLTVKAILFGLTAWFVIEAAGVAAFRIPLFIHRPSSDAFSTLIGSIVFGFTLGQTLRLWKR